MQVHRLVDDLDGSIDDVRTRQFSLDGRQYEIDLSAQNYQVLVETFEPFILGGRPKGGRKQPNRIRTSTQNRAIRDWAREQGYDHVSDRGRLSSAIISAYTAAHSDE
jgi:hypothetical protein